MGEQEKELLERIRKEMDSVQVPEGLQPEAVEKKLTQKKRRKWRSAYTYGLAAACCLIVVGAVSVYGIKRQGNTGGFTDSNTGKAVKENETIEKKQADAGDSEGVIPSAQSYEEIYKYIQQSTQRAEAYNTVMTEEAVVSDNASGARSAESKEMAVADTADYSQTNVREQGVGEGDTVKTDGKYLYVLKENRNKISIIKPDHGEMREVSSITMDAGDSTQISVEEFYVENEKLISISNVSKEKKNGAWESTTQADTYDVSNVEKAKHLGTVAASGNYDSSRLVDGYLYLFSTFYPQWGCEEADTEDYIPAVNGDMIEAKDIYMPSFRSGNMYTLLSAFAVSDPGNITDSKAVFSQGGLLYVSGSHIYMCDTDYSTYEDGEQTQIRKIAYEDGRLVPKAQNVIQGAIKDSFCIDEYDGNVRIAATVNKVVTNDGLFSGGIASAGRVTTNTLYVLDEKLEETGKITDLAKDESVKSARFFGDTGYFVTFRETDPLFSVDLSDPKNPEIIGELKIPGFSEYLHFYGEGKLLGIGQEVNALTGAMEGIKLSMFDISDPSNVKEEDKYIIEGSNYSDALSDYKAVLVNTDKNVIALPVYSGTYTSTQQYMVFSYDDGFDSRMELDLGSSGMIPRGVYIGDIIYVVNGNTIQSFDMKDYKKIGDLVL